MDARILAVEDDPDDREFIRAALAAAGAGEGLVFAEDGARALELLAQETPALVLLDLMLPRVSGLEVLKTARAREATRRVPVVVFTSSRLPEDVKAAWDLGANSFVVKPSDPAAFSRAVADIARYWQGLNLAPSAAERL